ncbi:MAG: hypothetical protein ACI8ZV_000521, partial [Chitinophagales bacterium]
DISGLAFYSYLNYLSNAISTDSDLSDAYLK